MNKKLLALVMIVIVLATLCAGCTMFAVDENRNYHQVVATVNYKGMTADIYRGDVLTYVINYGGQYIQNYGMTPEQVVEYFYNNLSKQKLLLLYAKSYVANNILGVSDDAQIAKMANKDFLTIDELRYCIERTNKQFDDLWKENISSLEKEQEANKGEQNKPEEDEEEKKDEKELEARPSKPEKTPSTEYVDEGLTDEGSLPKYFDKIATEKINAEKDTKAKNNMRTALSDLNKSLEKNFHDYDYFLNQQIESRIVEKYEKAVGKTVEISDTEIAGRYERLLSTDITRYVDEEAYAAAVDGNTFSLYHTNDGYSKVKSILLSFNDTQEALLKLVKETNSNEEYVKQFRNDMALGNVTTDKYPADLVAMLKDKDPSKDSSLGIRVNVSNPKYDAKEDELKDAYTDKNVSMNVVLYAMANAIAAKVDTMKAALEASKITDEKQIKAAIDYATTEAFVDWIYLVNDDPGMFKGDNYTITRDGAATSYVEEYTVLGRELNKEGGVGSFALTDKGSNVKNDTLVYGEEGKEGFDTEMFKAVNGKVATISKRPNVESTVKDDEKISTDIYTLTTAEGNSISYIINDFGVHIIMVVDEPFDADAAGVVAQHKDEKNPEKITGYELTQEYVYKQEVKVTYKKVDGEETDEIEKVEVTTKTIKDYVKDMFQSEKESDKGTEQQIELFSDESLIQKNEKVYNKILKEIKA